MRRLQLGESAPLLLHKVELDAAGRLGGGNNLLPGRDTFAEQYPIALLVRLGARRPILEVDAADPARGAVLLGRRRTLPGCALIQATGS